MTTVKVCRTSDGTNAGSPLYVMAKEDAWWLLTACRNALVVEPSGR
jgi:hypothetical protein